jgi:hypothetical protein
MRGNGIGVEGIGEVPGDTCLAGHTNCSIYGWGLGRKRDTGVVDGRDGAERGARDQHGGNWWSVSDDARDEDGDSDVHGTGSGGAYGLRGDGVGVGDIGEVQCGAGGAGVEVGSGDCRSCGPRP